MKIINLKKKSEYKGKFFYQITSLTNTESVLLHPDHALVAQTDLPTNRLAQFRVDDEITNSQVEQLLGQKNLKVNIKGKA